MQHKQKAQIDFAPILDLLVCYERPPSFRNASTASTGKHGRMGSTTCYHCCNFGPRSTKTALSKTAARGAEACINKSWSSCESAR